jgi:hypothetical protein
MVDRLLGRSFAKQFRLDKCINEGAFGKLYMALNVQSGQHVAVKLEPGTLRPSPSTDGGSSPIHQNVPSSGLRAVPLEDGRPEALGRPVQLDLLDGPAS